MTALVLDASASVELLLDTKTGRRLHRLVPSAADWWVPEHYFVEGAGALRRAALRRVVPGARLDSAFAQLARAPVRRAQVRPLLADAWAMRGNLSIADAVYVALAARLSGQLVTADMNLANAPGLPVVTIHP